MSRVASVLRTWSRESARFVLAAGIPAPVMQRRLGHSSIQITIDRYTHAIPALQQAAAVQIAAFVYGSRD
jgi:integrase